MASERKSWSLTSYSHRGGYYTLDELVDFDERGLWSFAGVRFSRIGTLIATAESFANLLDEEARTLTDMSVAAPPALERPGVASSRRRARSWLRSASWVRSSATGG